MFPLTFEVSNHESFPFFEHKATSVRTPMWWGQSVSLAAWGIYLEKAGAPLIPLLSFLFICQERFKVNGCSKWKGSLQIENIPHNLKSDGIFIPCVELAALYPLVQMVVCNFYSIWPQNGREERTGEEIAGETWEETFCITFDKIPSVRCPWKRLMTLQLANKCFRHRSIFSVYPTSKKSLIEKQKPDQHMSHLFQNLLLQHNSFSCPCVLQHELAVLICLLCMFIFYWFILSSMSLSSLPSIHVFCPPPLTPITHMCSSYTCPCSPSHVFAVTSPSLLSPFHQST